jgi:hypothetical protein
MRTSLKHLLTAASAVAILATCVGLASANNLSVSNQNVRAVWGTLEFSGAGATIRCPVTLEGSFHTRTIAKVVGSLIGHITRAVVARPCAGGTAWTFNGSERNEVLGSTTFPNSLPWHITYEGFGGALPTPSSIRILLRDARFQIRATVLGITLLCVYTTGTAGNATGTVALNGSGVASTITASGSISSSSGGLCPTGSFAGVGNVTLLGNTTSITVRLI